MDDRNKKHRQAHGVTHSRAKLNDDAVRSIRELHNQVSTHDLANTFGVTYSTICNVIAKRIWRHVP
jgi:DNA-binding transcriptional regulator YiaG